MGKSLERLSLTVLGACLVGMMFVIVVQVACSAFDLNPLVAFDRARSLVGGAITLNSLLDLQWHLLVITGLLPAGLVWMMDGHVRVDFLYQTFRPRRQARINLAGNLIFAAPFLALALPAAWNFTSRAWRSDEGSSNGGLADLWLIKAILPLGLALLAVAVLVECWRLLRAVR
ncbi:TRAP transporter small permease subunit [Salipiger sp.]|uniref:TRAP transporter small permease subunit n=1 Tax=Salipiger sp. TaxID=2078585 RepID=UPI003A96C0EE